MRHFVRHKAGLATRAVRKHRVKSFADIGGCWGVHAGYTVHLLANNPIERAYVADGNVNEQSRAAGKPYPQLEFIEGQFNEPAFIAPFPEVDALIMYSILLHQANLDWDDLLEAWAPKARVIVVYNHMWKKSDETIRFVDRGRYHSRDASALGTNDQAWEVAVAWRGEVNVAIDECCQSADSSIAELFPESLKTALIDHVIQLQFVRELSGALLAQLRFFDLNVDAFIVRGND